MKIPVLGSLFVVGILELVGILLPVDMVDNCARSMRLVRLPRAPGRLRPKNGYMPDINRCSLFVGGQLHPRHQVPKDRLELVQLDWEGGCSFQNLTDNECPDG